MYDYSGLCALLKEPKYEDVRGYLIDTFLYGQDTFMKLLEMFDIKLK